MRCCHGKCVKEWKMRCC
ncbi:hypothetical protein AVEN_184424-1, partial [Araneus ventricosus]